MVAEYDAAPAGEKGAVLRREWLYHSHIMERPAARDAAGLAALPDRCTSPARPKKAGEAAELERLRKKVARLEKDLARQDAALQVLGEASALLEPLAESADWPMPQTRCWTRRSPASRRSWARPRPVG
ncbi:hypothetical protein AB0O01_30055 [Streptomyces sp. NPDC093252]|uniref:hypothetical protein n=1 Tax=Streptomyces sp. NPDC093252 TaxID=3154980 RepID=UPI00341C8C03